MDLSCTRNKFARLQPVKLGILKTGYILFWDWTHVLLWGKFSVHWQQEGLRKKWSILIGLGDKFFQNNLVIKLHLKTSNKDFSDFYWDAFDSLVKGIRFWSTTGSTPLFAIICITLVKNNFFGKLSTLNNMEITFFVKSKMCQKPGDNIFIDWLVSCRSDYVFKGRQP